MLIEIDQPVTPQKVQDALGKIQNKTKKSLRRHFGKLKRGLNAVSYQNKVRNDWK